MKIHLLQTIKTSIFGILIPLSMAVASMQVQAATVALAEAPLVNSTTAQVLPNVMYILDNSGSMGWDFMPDYVNDNNTCKSTGTSGAFTAACQVGDPPYMSSQFNGIYYNPATTYSPGLLSNGIERDSMNSTVTAGWTSVRTDPYNIQNRNQLGNNTNFVSLVPSVTDANVGYPDRFWCSASYTGTADLNNPAICKKNSQYIYPANTGNAVTTFATPVIARTHPYYYTVAPGEFCTDKELTSCIAGTAATGGYTYPATLRWCNSSARTTCQARFIQSTGFTHAKWSGYQVGSQASATIKILPQAPANSPATSPVALSVTNITVDGVPIIAMPATGLTITDTTNSGQRSTLATNIRNAINAYSPTVGDDFVAAVSGDTVTLTRVGAGSFSGVLDVATSTHTTTAVAGTFATGSINITRAGRTSGTSSSLSINNVKFGPSNVTITNGTVTTTNGLTNAAAIRDLATKLKNSINARVSSPDFTASCAGGVNCTSGLVTITAVTQGNPISGNLTVNPTSATGSPSATTNALQYSVTNMSGGVLSTPAQTYILPTQVVSFTGGVAFANTFTRVDIEPSTTSYPKAASRTDCLGATTCTYTEEMTNFANWYSYYRTRMQMMKTSTSRAFKLIDGRYRVGFITINDQTSGTNYLPVNKFSNTQKNSWYQSLENTAPGSGTPLRTALSMVGRIFAGKKPVGSADPMQYSCQQNFSILTTDGYWNGGVGTDIDGNAIGDRDGTGTPRPMFQGPAAAGNTLADAAKYYYDADIRNSSFANCTGGPRPDGSVGDVCEDNVFVTPTDNNVKQHMTTFTLGLGVDGELAYQPDYQVATSGDFYELKQGTRNWPQPVNDSQSAVDDLWHAAVNGQGTYFSAKDPNQLSSSLNEALQSIGAKAGAGAAAASSNLSPVAGDNAVYFASYQSVKWTGNLEARTVNIDNGTISPTATWAVEDVTADTCVAPSAVQSETTPSGTQYYCVTPSATLATCSGADSILDGTNCKVPIAVSRAGTLKNKVTATTDSRTIYMKVGGALGAFNFANVAASGLDANYLAPFLANNLSQWNALTTAQKTAAAGANFIKFLRGQNGFENRTANYDGTTDNRIFRLREAVMGDPIDSAPVFVGAPKQNYSDPGYGPVTQSGTFKNAKQSRAGIIYLGTNDGMLHAFDSTTGEERWAYVPTAVIPNMWKLGDKNYGSNHANFVNGEVTVHDYCESGCSSASAVWKTILIGGLGSGGKGYYALDVTDPFAPQLKWEFGVTQDKDVGFSYGNPVMTKKTNGDWVVLLTSGYNNTDTSAANPGKGVLFVLNPSNGAVINKLVTSAGSATDPSGLAKIAVFIDSQRNNTVRFVYGGDLAGNLWRFDFTQVTLPAPFKMVEFGTSQPITTRPELSEINGKRVVYVGTGQFLETNDLTTTSQQTIYAITDTSATTLSNPRSNGSLVKQEIQSAGATRTQTSTLPVDYNSMRGWYVDFPDSGERVNVAPQLVFGTLVVPSIVPSSTFCSPGGTGWLNFFDYKTGGVVQPGGVVSKKTNAPIVGLNVFFLKNGPVVSTVTSTGEIVNAGAIPTSDTSSFSNHGVIWRELINEE